MTTKIQLATDFSLPLDVATRTMAILGQRGSGKTTTAVVLVEEMLAAHVPVVVLDPTGAWWGLRSSADGRGEGFPVTILGGEHGDLPLEPTGGALVADLVVEQRMPLVLDLSTMSIGEQRRLATDFAERLYHCSREATHVVIDESDEFIPQRPPPGCERMLGAFNRIVRRGRIRGLGVTLISQRAAVISKDVLTQIDTLITLRTTSPQDRAAIEAWVSQHGDDQQRRKLMDVLASLPTGAAWFWSPSWLDEFRRVHVRPRKTFDSSATPKVGAARVVPRKLAPVDLEQLRVRMAATIEKVKADDPKLLRARITELERELIKLRAEKTATRIERIEVPVVTEKDLVRMEGAASKLQEALTAARAIGSRAELEMNRHYTEVQRAIPKAALQKRVPSRKTETGRVDGDRPLNPGERAILIAIAQNDEAGCTRQQLSVITGYKKSSYNTYLHRLSVRGLVRTVADALVATDEGLDELGSDYEPLPTGDALRKYWFDRLKIGERKVLDIVCLAYPKAVERRVIMDRTGYTKSSCNTYLHRLSARRLVDASSPGQVTASELLFG